MKDRFFKWLKHKVFKIPEGKEITGLCLIIKIILYPRKAWDWYFNRRKNYYE